MAHITLRNLVAQRPDIKRRKRQGRTAKPVRPSKKDELWYKVNLRTVVGALKKTTNEQLLPLLKTLEPTYAKDANPEDQIKAQIDKMAQTFGGIDGVAQRLAAEASRRALDNVDKMLSTSLKNATGVDVSSILTQDATVTQALQFHTLANVDLIKSIPEEYFDKIEQAVMQNFEAGIRYEDLAEIIQHIGDVTDSRADLIARDQTSKMNGAFNEIRQSELGIDSYIWQGAEDERERETHLANEGQIFRWDDPPETGHPGEDIQCRCVAIPYFDLNQ